MKPIYRSTWFKLLAGLVILLLALITFLPYGVRYAIERWYLQQDADQVLIDDIDINLFTGKLHVYDFKALRSGEVLMQFESAGLEMEWLPLFKKRALLSTLHVNGLQTTITQLQDGQIRVAGITPRDSDKKSNNWGLGIQGVSINNTLLTLDTPQQQYKIGINAVVLDHIESWSADQSHIKFSGEINNAPVSLDAQFNAFSNRPLFEGILSVKSMDLNDVSIYVEDKIQTLRGKVDLNAEFRLIQKNKQNFNFKSNTSLDLKKLSLANPSLNLNSDLVSLKGNLDLSWDHKFVISQFGYDGKITAENTNGGYQNNYIFHNDQFEWKGTVNSESPNSPYKLAGVASARGLNVDDRVSAIELVKAEHLTIKQLSASSDLSLQAKDWAIDNFTLLLAKNPADQTPLLQAKKLSVNQTDYSETQLELGDLTIQQALIDIDRQKDGRIRQLALLAKESSGNNQASGSSAASSSTNSAKSFGIKISQLNLSPNSIIRFNDASVEPKFKTEIDIQQATLKQLDSSQPTSQSPVVIKAKLDKYSSILLDGYIKPFTQPIDLNLQAILKGIALPPLSSYSASIIGYDMVSGQLNADSKLEIKNGKIDGSNKLIINNLEIKPADPEKSDKLNAELSMPLESALSLLLDKNNDIKLTLPVTGDINNPDFDISGIINKALGNALKKTSLTYLTLALQPYGSLIAIVNLAKDAANQVNLNPIEFSAGSSALNQTARDYITKLSTVLTDRPQLRLKLCGYTTPKDKIALSGPQNKTTGNTPTTTSDNKTSQTTNKDMQALASNRAEAIKDRLINTHKIEASRLFICKPEIDKKPDSKPRVEITL